MIIKPYLHDPQQHMGFVLSSFCLQTAMPDSVFRDLIRDGAVIKVAESSHGLRQDGAPICNAWAATHKGALVYCYVKHDLREFPYLPRLFESLGLDNASEIPCMFLTSQLRAIAHAWGFNFTQWVDPQKAN